MIDISVLYEDQDLMVVDKPSGITVNRSDTTSSEETIQDWAENRIQQSDSPVLGLEEKDDEEIEEGEYGNDFYKRGGIVHRLDKETSGILLVAKTPDAFLALQRQFKERTVEKTYWALVHDKILPLTGEIHVPIGRLSWNRKKFGVVAGGRDAVTYYKVLQFYTSRDRKDYSFVELYPKTGRTHQIRVHLAYLRRPIVSDMLYGGRKVARDDRKLLGRVFLHAVRISFHHPSSGEAMRFESVLPRELEEFVAMHLIKSL
jgi:23S rRNA pseudouridine1911/1915/1917 synthase